MDSVLTKGETLLAEGRVEEAADCFRRLLDREPTNCRVLNNLGVIAYHQRDGRGAADYFMRSIQADSSFTDPVANLCTLLRASGHLREALPILEPLAAKYPDNEEVADLLAEARGTAATCLSGARLAIINPWDNKFTDLYTAYFARSNEVRRVKPQTEADLKDILSWADIIWSQWCNEPLVYLSRQTTDAALVTHIHSFEILTPQLMQGVNWKRIDGAIFVADHMRANANRLWSNQLDGVPQATIYNSVDLRQYPKYDGHPGHNIGYVGYLNHKKGVGLLLQCVKAAVDLDPSYRLHVAGTFQETRFEVYMTHLIEQMGLTDHVVMHGWVKDVPLWLKSMNYVISTSPWEGCPLNIIEAMACGIKPLIHNWQGAATLFPKELVFNTVGDFVKLLTPKEYDSDSYRQHVERHFNADINVPAIDRYLLERVESRRSRPAHKVSRARSAEVRAPMQSAAEATMPEPSGTIDFHQPLARTVEVSSNRKSFTVDFCRGKRVLHVGCVDAGIMESRIKSDNFLHYHISQVADQLIGVDIETAGLERLKEEGYEVYRLDLESDDELLRDLARRVDVIVIPEVIEHLNNVGDALDNLRASGFTGDILLSTPNAFSLRTIRLLGSGVELVHPDHNYYYSPTTLKTLLRKHGFDIRRLVMYYWPTDDEVGRELQKMVTTSCPYYAEGMIAIIGMSTEAAGRREARR
ncbi:MAG: glycosyltransferase [candidate division Zixibacteria bacterium]|jgi:glycosyltransferase involved in cell wall biosynthesis|nr:glycosyltransferase [candidate division Zixibacteria bacterium]